MLSSKNATAAAAVVAIAVGTGSAKPQSLFDLLAPKTVCFIYHQNGAPASPYMGSDGRAIGLTRQQCAQANAAAQEMEAAQRQQAEQQRAIVAQTPAPPPSQAHLYQPTYSERVEADNGAVYAVDLKTARHFGNLVQAGVYDPNRQIQIAGPMWFQCGHSLVGTDPRSMTYAPPRSVGARLLAIACAEADRHPER